MLMWYRPIHVEVAAGSQQSRALCVADHDEERGDLHRRAAGVTEFGIRDNVPNTDGIRDIFFFGIRDIVLDI